MDVKFNVKYKFKVNGKEYGSLEEMPAPIRETYEKAVANSKGKEHANIPSVTAGKINYNGQEYESMDVMPADIRQMYETVMKTVKSGGVATLEKSGFKIGVSKDGIKDMGMINSAAVPKPITPQWFLSPTILLIIGIILALLAGYYLLGGIGLR
jgi:predicted methyltransferase